MLKPCSFELLIASSKDILDKYKIDGSMHKGLEIIDVRTQVMSVYASFRVEFLHKSQHCLEICGYGESENDIHFCAAYDNEQITVWL